MYCVHEPLFTVHSGAETIQERKLFKGGNTVPHNFHAMGFLPFTKFIENAYIHEEKTP